VEADVLAACRTQLADFKVPRLVRLVDEMPRSALNKIAKAQLRQSLVDKACQAPALTPDPRTEREP
jgi:crotonobetaine/carnitine-CoA ligase